MAMLNNQRVTWFNKWTIWPAKLVAELQPLKQKKGSLGTVVQPDKPIKQLGINKTNLKIWDTAWWCWWWMVAMIMIRLLSLSFYLRGGWFWSPKNCFVGGYTLLKLAWKTGSVRQYHWCGWIDFRFHSASCLGWFGVLKNYAWKVQTIFKATGCDTLTVDPYHIQ